jgi:hypothetical protein
MAKTRWLEISQRVLSSWQRSLAFLRSMGISSLLLLTESWGGGARHGPTADLDQESLAPLHPPCLVGLYLVGLEDAQPAALPSCTLNLSPGSSRKLMLSSPASLAQQTALLL